MNSSYTPEESKAWSNGSSKELKELVKSFKQNIVAELDEPLVTKDSREKLHDTTASTAQSIKHAECLKKTREYFADTICEVMDELTGEEVYQAFYEACKALRNITKKEYNNANELFECLDNKPDVTVF
jgi:divalent metal cation (Fe/Co/Zn/Cd) transporter